ncbi:MAG: ABC transporter permease [Actinomycetota bacterium]|nr:ABC transporter permease [Actinomycetota bacterium]
MSNTLISPTPMDLSATPQVSMGRLAKVEFRKALDTRAGRWFAGSIVALCLAVVIIVALVVPEGDQNFLDFLGIAGAVLTSFLPILIIMLVTGEAGQRTGLVTFTLEPRRPRIVLAKFLAGIALAFCVMVLAAVTAVIGTVVATFDGGTTDWSLDGNLVFNGFVLANLIQVFIGFALGMLLMNTAAAIVGYFVYSLILPGVVGFLGFLSEGFEKLAPWIEFNTAQMPLFEGDYQPSGEEWAQIAVAGTIWLIIPLTLGIGRLLRIEFK